MLTVPPFRFFLFLFFKNFPFFHLDILDGQRASQNWPELHLAQVELAQVEKNDGLSQNWPE